jgi:hypothetical protein
VSHLHKNLATLRLPPYFSPREISSNHGLHGIRSGDAGCAAEGNAVPLALFKQR